MLVLSRKPKEKIFIYDEDGTELGFMELVHIGKGKAKVGILLPARFRLLRGEVAKKDKGVSGAAS